MTVRWITPLLGTAPASAAGSVADATIIDVRELVDRAGNDPTTLRNKIAAGVSSLRLGRKTLVCCDHGISRSNAVAAGILSDAEHIPLDEAIRKVIEKTGEREIRLDVVTAVRRALANSTSAESFLPSGERWLLTGGSGALASSLLAAAPTNIEILCPNRRDLDLLAGGVSLDLYAGDHGISRIIHFASPRISNTNTSLGEALTMMRSVLEVASSRGLPLLIPSRWEVFGGYRGETFDATEETPARPSGVLGDTKYLIESLALSWARQQQVKVTILRSGLVFGRNLAPNFIRSFILKARTGSPIATHRYENGPPLLDLISAEDWAQACLALLRTGETGLFQAGGGGLTSTREIAEMAVRASGRGCQIMELPVEGKSANIRLDFGKLEQAVGWRPSRPVGELLADFLGQALDDRTPPEKGR